MSHEKKLQIVQIKKPLRSSGVKAKIAKKWLSPAHRKRTKFPLASISNITQLAPIKSLKNEDFLRRKYLEKGLSLQEIAAETVSSWKTVRRHLLYFKVPLRNEDALVGKTPQFGFKFLDGNLAVATQEQEKIELITKLRKSGFSFRAIVRELNTQQIPTRKIGAKWHLKTVANILSRSKSSLKAHQESKLL